MIIHYTNQNGRECRRILSGKSKNYLRDEIINNNYMEHIADVEISDVQKAIMRDYVDGKSQRELADNYNLSKSRIHQIIVFATQKLRQFFYEKA